MKFCHSGSQANARKLFSDVKREPGSDDDDIIRRPKNHSKIDIDDSDSEETVLQDLFRDNVSQLNTFLKNFLGFKNFILFQVFCIFALILILKIEIPILKRENCGS